MPRLFLLIGLLMLCPAALCDDLTLDQLSHTLPRGTIFGVPLGDPMTIQCQVESFAEGPSAERIPGATYIAINAIGTAHAPKSESNVGYFVELRSSLTLKPDIKYTFEGYETGEFIRTPPTDDPTAAPPLRFHPYFVVTKLISPADAKPAAAPAAKPAALPFINDDGNELPLYQAAHGDAPKPLWTDYFKDLASSPVPTPEAAEQLGWTEISPIADYERVIVTGLYHIDPTGKTGLKDFATSTDWVWEVRLISAGVDGIYLINAQSKKVRVLLSTHDLKD